MPNMEDMYWYASQYMAIHTSIYWHILCFKFCFVVLGMYEIMIRANADRI